MPKEKKAKKDKEEKKDGRGERKPSFFGFGKKKEKENDAKRPGSVEITDNRRDSANITSSSRIGQEVSAMSDGKKEPMEVNQPHNGSFLVSIPRYEQTVIKWNKRRFVT
jgi:hypothetical protein